MEQDFLETSGRMMTLRQVCRRQLLSHMSADGNPSRKGGSWPCYLVGRQPLYLFLRSEAFTVSSDLLCKMTQYRVCLPLPLGGVSKKWTHCDKVS